MAAEPILIVDAAHTDLTLARDVLTGRGYSVRTASSAAEALELLREYRPHLVLTALRLPDMDGVELTRRIKADPATASIAVIALIPPGAKADEQKASEAGCDGFIAKPLDGATLGERVREYMDARGRERAAAPAVSAPQSEALPDDDMAELRHRFLEEGQDRSRRVLADLDGAFDPALAARYVHQWIGSGGLLGFNEISRLSREVETLLLERPVDTGQGREELTALITEFSSQAQSLEGPLPEAIIRLLAGKTVAGAGMPASEAQRLSMALERAHARSVFFEAGTTPQAAEGEQCDVAVTWVPPESGKSPWLGPEPPTAERPAVLVGHHDHLMALEGRVLAKARQVLMDSWQPDEALVRLSLALLKPQPPSPAALAPAPRGRIRALVSDDDPKVGALVRGVLEHYGLECIEAGSGPDVLRLVREQEPAIVLLEAHAYDVVKTLRAEGVRVPILLLTTREHQADVIHGCTLGADDYIVKPFSPSELVARIRLLVATVH